jgi:CHAD domain-containing protein
MADQDREVDGVGTPAADTGSRGAAATRMRETEWKYEAPPGGPVPDLMGLPSVAAQSDPGVQELTAVYYDTDDLLLARAGITLRRRTGGDDDGWHLKLPYRPGTRTEIRMPLDRDVPAGLYALISSHVRGRPVRPVARIETRRQRAVLLDDSGVSLAEVVADDVSAQGLGDPPTSDRWSEVEVELTGGGVELLQSADARLHECGLVRSARASKLERALGERLTNARYEATVTEKKALSTAADVVCAYLRTQRDELVDQDPWVRLDESEAVHDMRVAARRLRSALQAFGRVLRPEETARVVEDLRWLGQALGQARDEEVVAERLETALAQLPSDLVIGPVAQRIAEYRAPHEDTAPAVPTDILDSRHYVSLLDALDDLIEAPPLASDADRRAAKLLPKLVCLAFRRVGKRAADAFTADAGEQRDVALHATRKAAKRARYAAEVVLLATGDVAVERTIADLKDLQTALGDHQDTVLTRRAAYRMGIDAHNAGENAFTYGLLHERESEAADASLDRGRQVWYKATRAKRTRWMR